MLLNTKFTIFVSMISVQTIVDRLNSALDNEGYDHYTFDRDYRYALSYAQEFVCSVLDRTIGKTRFVEERLSDLLYTNCWVTNQYSRFSFEEPVIGRKLWAIIAIYIDPTIVPVAYTQADINKSVYLRNYSYISSYKSAWRVTAEEHSMNSNNPFAPGNKYHEDCEELNEYGYLSPVNLGSGYNAAPGVKEITMTRSYVNRVLAMQYIAYPNPIMFVTDNLPFPPSMADMILNKALYFISMKRGDVPLPQVTENDVKQLTGLLV